MKDRITREQLNMQIAHVVSQRATCGRAKVGAVITTESGRIISTGYNGPLPEHSHCDRQCDISKPCTRSVHAEANAIYNAARHGISLQGSELYCTHRPCLKCFEAIVQSGIKTVLYQNPHPIPNMDDADIRKMYEIHDISLVHLLPQVQ